MLLFEFHAPNISILSSEINIKVLQYFIIFRMTDLTEF